jgi:hypothetical protein
VDSGVKLALVRNLHDVALGVAPVHVVDVVLNGAGGSIQCGGKVFVFEVESELSAEYAGVAVRVLDEENLSLDFLPRISRVV